MHKFSSKSFCFLPKSANFLRFGISAVRIIPNDSPFPLFPNGPASPKDKSNLATLYILGHCEKNGLSEGSIATCSSVLCRRVAPGRIIFSCLSLDSDRAFVSLLLDCWANKRPVKQAPRPCAPEAFGGWCGVRHSAICRSTANPDAFVHREGGAPR